jgi:hypothetical protein
LPAQLGPPNAVRPRAPMRRSTASSTVRAGQSPGAIPGDRSSNQGVTRARRASRRATVTTATQATVRRSHMSHQDDVIVIGRGSPGSTAPGRSRRAACGSRSWSANCSAANAPSTSRASRSRSSPMAASGSCSTPRGAGRRMAGQRHQRPDPGRPRRSRLHVSRVGAADPHRDRGRVRCEQLIRTTQSPTNRRRSR